MEDNKNLSDKEDLQNTEEEKSEDLEAEEEKSKDLETEEELDPSIATKVKELRAIVEDASKSVQQQSDEILSALVSNAVGFGYPNGEELQLGVKTQLSIDEQIKHQTQLSYTAGANKESFK